MRIIRAGHTCIIAKVTEDPMPTSQACLLDSLPLEDSMTFADAAANLHDQALNSYQQALLKVREVGNRAGEGVALHNIGGVYDSQGLCD